MKLNTTTKDIQSAGMSINVDFKIDMNPKTISVLSKDMYSDIQTTIVRELSSNAHDAHIAAGKPDVQFEVSCPTAFDPFFSVKDFGTGLRYFMFNAEIVNEHEGESTVFIDGDIRKDIEGINLIVLNSNQTVNIGALLYDNTEDKTVLRIPVDVSGKDISVEFDDTLVLYSTYFRSTKEQSNDFTGAFGLGSKTPLAYTDNFIVTNRYNGTQRVYNIILNQDGMPQINLMDTSETDEGNGLEVKLAVGNYDYHDFKEAIASQLKYFDPQPIVKNDVVEFPKLVHRGKHFLLYEDLEDYCSYQYGKGHACVGNNAYEISNLSNDLFKKNMVVRFDIGEVMVTASREDLQYDDKTNDMIRNRESEAVKEYTDYVLNTLDDDNMSEVEKVEFLNNNHRVLDLSTKNVISKVGNPNYKYSNGSIKIRLTGWGDYTTLRWIETEDEHGNVTRKLGSHGHYTRYGLRWSEYCQYKGKTDRIGNSQNIFPSEKYTVFVRDNSYSFLKKIKYYIEQNEIDTHNIRTLDGFDDDSLEALKEVAGDNLDLVFLSSITLPKNISTTAYGSCTTPVARLFNSETHHFDSVSYWNDVYTPLTQIDTNAYVVCTHRCEIEGLSYNDVKFMDYYFKGSFPFDTDTVILALPRAKYEKALSYGFKPLSDLVAELKKNVVIPVDLVNRNGLKALYEKLDNNSVLDRVKDVRKSIFKELNEDHPIHDLLRARKIYKKRYQSSRAKFAAIERVMHYMEIDDMPKASKSVKEAVDKYGKMCDNLSTELPLVAEISSWRFGEDLQKAVIKYANMMFNTGE